MVHKAQQDKTGPIDATRSHQAPKQQFSAGSSFVQRIKRAADKVDTEPKLVKRRKKAHKPQRGGEGSAGESLPG